MKTHGADILRLWVVSGDYTEDLRIGKEILDGIADTYRRLRNTLRYLLGNLAGFTRSRAAGPGARCRSSSAGCCTGWPSSTSRCAAATTSSTSHAVRPAAQFLRRATCRPSTSTSARTRSTATRRQHPPPCRAHRAGRAVPLPDRVAGPGAVFTAEEAWLTRYARRPGQRASATFPDIPAEWRSARAGRAGSASARSAASSPARWSSSGEKSGSVASLQAAPVVYRHAGGQPPGRPRSGRARDHRGHPGDGRPGAGRRLHARGRGGRRRGARLGRGREMRALLAGPAGSGRRSRSIRPCASAAPTRSITWPRPLNE